MHKNREAKTRQDQIRLPRQILPVQPESISHRMKVLPHCQFRLGMLAPDCGHHSRPDGCLNDVSHVPAVSREARFYLGGLRSRTSAPQYRSQASAISSCGTSAFCSFSLAATIRSFMSVATASKTGTATELPNWR